MCPAVRATPTEFTHVEDSQDCIESALLGVEMLWTKLVLIYHAPGTSGLALLCVADSNL